MPIRRAAETVESYEVAMTEKQGFELRAHFLGTRRSVDAAPDGFGWQVQADSGHLEARSLEQAIRIAEQHIGELLRRVERRPGWGLSVIAGPTSASYDEPDPLEVALPSGRPASPDSLVARIHSRWNPGSSPVSALQNAVEIIRAYLGNARGRAAA